MLIVEKFLHGCQETIIDSLGTRAIESRHEQRAKISRWRDENSLPVFCAVTDSARRRAAREMQR